MKKQIGCFLVLICTFCVLSFGYATDTGKIVPPMLSLLLGNSGGTVITKSVSGQPGTVVKILLGDDHPAGDLKYVKMGDKEVIPASWDDMTNEIKAMIPPVAAGEYRVSVVFKDAQTPTIPLMVLPFALPKGKTADSVVADVQQNMQTMFQSVTGFMANTGYAQTNLNTLNGILGIFMDQYSQMTTEEKEFFATFLNNADIAGLLQEMETAEAKVAQAKTASIKRSPTKPPCMTVTPITDEYTCKTYDRWDELAKYRSYYRYLKFIDTCVNDCISYITDILGATDCVADAGRFAMLTKSITILGTAINSAKTVLGTMPIILTDLDVTVNNTILSYYDETGFTATATMEPASTVLGGIVHEMILLVGSKLKTKLKKIEDNACWLELANNEIDTVKGLLDQYIGDEYFKVDASSAETVTVPPHELYVSNEYYTDALTTFCAYPYTHYGDTLYVKESLTSWGGSEKQVLEEVIFKYPYTLSHDYNITAESEVEIVILTIKNRAPEMDPFTVSVDPENELNKEIIIDLENKDQECDRITKWEIVGTAQYGTLDESFLVSNELHYTLTTAIPEGNEIFTLRFFDGAEWGETTLTIDLSVVNCTYTSGTGWVQAFCATTNDDGSSTTTNFREQRFAGAVRFGMTVDDSFKSSSVEWFVYDETDPLYDEGGSHTVTNNSQTDYYHCSSSSNYYWECIDITGDRRAYIFENNNEILQYWCQPKNMTQAEYKVFVDQCYQKVKQTMPVEISQHLYQESCHDWWDHYDEDGVWQECEE